MANKKIKPAAGKSVAGKKNSKNKSAASAREKEKKRAQEQKYAKRIEIERQKKQEERLKKSKEIQKRREKQSKIERKSEEKIQSKKIRSKKIKQKINVFKLVWDKIKYYTSSEFLSSFNYVRIFIFVVVPVALLIFGTVLVSQSVLVNVPISVKSADYNGRTESELIACDSVFNAQQQKVFTDSLNAKGSKKFAFYINSVIDVNDQNSTDDLCFGNPKSNNYILIATIYNKSGEILYRSLGLEPGKEVNEATFFSSLEYGTHDVKVAVNAYKKDTFEKVGTKYARIKLAVGVDYEGEQ